MRYTVEPGRWIYKDGVPFVPIGCAHTSKATGSAAINPVEADELTRSLARWLNFLPDLILAAGKVTECSKDGAPLQDWPLNDLADAVSAISRDLV